MAEVSDEIGARWRRWLVERNRRGLRATATLGLTLYPAFGVLDWFVAPRRALPGLWSMRAAFVLLTMVAFRSLRTKAFERHPDLFAAGYLWAAAAGIAAMTVYLGGLASPYYGGLTLTIVAAGLLFVWPPRVVVAEHVGIVGTFVAVNLLASADGLRVTSLSNLAFLSATALVAGVGQVLLFRTLRDQHEQRVRLEVTTAHLERAHAELKELDRFKSRFFANMTHELRTPLAMIVAPIELLLQGEMGEVTEAQRGSFQTMLKSAVKLLKLINDLLDLSRLEESRLRLDVGEHDLVEQLRNLTDQSQVLALRKGIALRFASDTARAPLWYDPERIERVFVNLLSNATKFTPTGGHVDVHVRDLRDAVEVTVQDDGPGFPPEEAGRIFGRFYQVDMGGTRQHGGTGIGLALARELVLLHGGAIEAQSDGRRGALFRVTLRKGNAQFGSGTLAAARHDPCPAECEPTGDWAVQLAARQDFRLLEIEEASDRRAVDRDPDEDARRYTALVVEDHPEVVRLVHMSLRAEFRVLTAPDGVKGLELARRQLPDLVVTDLMMPGLDGLSLTKRLREDPATRHIPVLMLSARGALDDRVSGLESGVSAYVTKPFSPKELVTTARRLVSARNETTELVLAGRVESLEFVAAGIAHEMNGPLDYLKNALGRLRVDADHALEIVQGARGRPLDASEAEQLERIGARLHELLRVGESGLKRMAQTIELMTRYGRSGLKRELAAVDAWELVRAVVGTVLPATGRDVRVELELQGAGTVECVPEELDQVLKCIVQNAIEAVPDQTGRVEILGTLEGDDLVVTVKDNGVGISPEVQARLFTPFFTTKRSGSGLGLTIARRVVQRLGGTLLFTSAPGAGTRFTVRLPREQKGAVLPMAS